MPKTQTIETVKNYLERKVGLFKQYEEITEGMLKSDIDDMLDFVKQRQDIAHQIDEIDAEISDLFTLSGNSQMKDVVSNNIEFGDCPEEYVGLFELGQQLRACFTHIARTEEQITIYVETKKEELLELIKAQNNDISAKSARYYGTVKSGDEIDYRLFDSKC